MKRIEDLPEEVYQVFEETFNTYAHLRCTYADVELWRHFFAAGYEAAIAERAKFDEQNGLIVKEISEL